MASASTTCENQFVAFTIYNTKEREQFMFLCQWTGNEEALTKFHKLVKYVHDNVVDIAGDVVDIKGDIDVKMSESSVNEMLKLNKYTITFCDFSSPFTKCYGNFVLPDPLEELLDDIDLTDPNLVVGLQVYDVFQYLYYPCNFEKGWENINTSYNHN
jgi:hypothetical protein